MIIIMLRDSVLSLTKGSFIILQHTGNRNKTRENTEINLFLIAFNFGTRWDTDASDRITNLRFIWPNALIGCYWLFWNITVELLCIITNSFTKQNILLHYSQYWAWTSGLMENIKLNIWKNKIGTNLADF